MATLRFAFAAMGCPCELLVDTDSERDARAALAIVEAEVGRLDRKYSHYRDDSLLAEIAALAGSDVFLDVDDETANLLDFADALHRQSGGLFDISAGALTRLWELSAARLPSAEAIAAVRERVGWDRVQWQRPRLRLPVAGMSLDFGGVVKEYAADRAATLCRDAGFQHGVVDLGGDLALIGAHRDGQPWSVGIKSPQDRTRACAQIELASGGLATSGDYERCVVIDGRRYSHVIDPVSGTPVQSFASVSVVANSCLVAGAAATVAMLRGVEAGLAWLEELGLPHLCVTTEGEVLGNVVVVSAPRCESPVGKTRRTPLRQ